MSGLPPQDLQRRFDAALRALQARNPAEARVLLEPVARAAPADPAVRALMGQVLFQTGDLAGAVREQDAAARAAPRDPAMQTGLGNLLRQAGRPEPAEAALRAALRLDRRFAPAVTALVELLLSQFRGLDALEVVDAVLPTRDLGLLTRRGDVLKAIGRKPETLAAYEAARDAHPGSGVAWHNVASAAGDLQRFALAESATAKAMSLKLDAPETWLVRARALQGLDRLDEAEAAFAEVLKRRPDYGDALRELTQLIWMRTGDADRALGRIDAGLRARPGDPRLAVERARFLDYVGRRPEADAQIRPPAARGDAQPDVLALAAQVCVRDDPERAAGYAERAHRLLPDSLDAVRTLAEARLAQGRPADAAPLVERLMRASPNDGGVLALQATVWRLLGDVRAGPLQDYDRVVRAFTIDAPPGWARLDAYLADLAAALTRVHTNTAHPIGQSLRGGSQTNVNLLESDDPAIKAFPQAVDGPIRDYIAALGPGDDPLRRRNTGAYRFSGIWSVRLKTGGHHTDHMHPEGWISSACYIAVPPAVDAGGREGWIRFGEPGLPTVPRLKAERWEKPAPGKLVLFPSYMWHGTEPFSGDIPRLTVAFDLVPA